MENCGNSSCTEPAASAKCQLAFTRAWGSLAEPQFMRQAVSSYSSLSHDSKIETFPSSFLSPSSFLPFSLSLPLWHVLGKYHGATSPPLSLSFICLLFFLDKLSCRAGLEFMTRCCVHLSEDGTAARLYAGTKLPTGDLSSCQRVWN